MNKKEFIDRYGPVAVVTGASSGIGKSFATLLAVQGLHLVLVARRIDRLETLATELSAQYGVEVKSCQVDLNDPSAAEQIFSATQGLDVGLLVSNAGFGFKGHYDEADPAQLSEMMMVNCHAPMLLARGFIPRLRRRGKGGIIFTGSIEGLMGFPYSTMYSATKGFIQNLGEGLWAELKPAGIDVLALCPGATDTEALARHGLDASTMENLSTPDEVAAKALEHIDKGPLYISSDYYRCLME